MNVNSSGPLDELQNLDRLVDGELSDRERQELLSRLDHQPDGWRRLALAFLEAQTWGEAAREDVAGAALVTTNDVRPAALAAGPTRNWRLLIGTPLAMAASFLLAFTLGIALRGAWRGSNQDAAMVVAGDAAQAERAAKNAIALAQANSADAAEDGSAADAEPAPTSDIASDGVDEVWLPNDSDTSDESTLTGSPAPAVPEQVLRSLRRLGHEVQTHHSFWPVDLKNGQRALVPVDEVEIRYVGNDYQ